MLINTYIPCAHTLFGGVITLNRFGLKSTEFVTVVVSLRVVLLLGKQSVRS